MSQNLTELKLTLQVMQAETTLEYHDPGLLAQNQFERTKSRGVLLEKCLRLLDSLEAEPAPASISTVQCDHCNSCYARCKSCPANVPAAPPGSQENPY